MYHRYAGYMCVHCKKVSNSISKDWLSEASEPAINLIINKYDQSTVFLNISLTDCYLLFDKHCLEYAQAQIRTLTKEQLYIICVSFSTSLSPSTVTKSLVFDKQRKYESKNPEPCEP